MRWFASFTITAVLVTLISVVFYLRQHSPFGVSEISSILQWIVPDVIYQAVRRFQIPIMFGCWALCNTSLYWLGAYHDAETEGSPRSGHTKTRTLNDAIRANFHNPTRWWLTGFATLITMLTAAVGLYLFWFNRNVIAVSAWGLTSLFGLTIFTALAKPDQPERFGAHRDERPDPILNIPESDSVD